MKKNLIRLAVVLTLGVATWGGYAAWRANKNLVTLDVRNMDVRDVVTKIEWQTWEDIFVHKDVQGKVTLKVHRVPLEEVLNIIGEQVRCRWTGVYPLYSQRASLKGLKKSLRGEVVAAESGWTNLNQRSFGFRGGMFAENVRSENDVLRVNFQNKDLPVATMALARYAQAQVVPEDGTAGTVSVSVNGGTMDDAVKQLARQTDRKWTHYYALLGGFDGFRGSRPQTAQGTNTFARQFEAQLETMSPEEREKALAERQRGEQMRAEMANLSPEQRAERMQQMMNSPEMQSGRARMESEMEKRMVSSMKNTTPQQRVERDKMFQQMQNMMRGGGSGGQGGRAPQ